MSTKLLFAAATFATALSAQASISIDDAAFTYAQSFNSLASSGSANVWANDTTLPGWSLFNGTTALTTYRASSGTDNAGAVYSFGAAVGERALGTVASGTVASPTLALSFKNDTGGALSSFTLGYDGEQWRNGGNTAMHTLTVQYGFGASFAGVAWLSPGAGFDVPSVVHSATAGAVIGNTTGLTAGLGGTVTTTWAAGDTLWVRWVDVNDVGADHGMAIDNLSFSVTAAPVPEPSTYALLLAGLGAVGFIARRRRG